MEEIKKLSGKKLILITLSAIGINEIGKIFSSFIFINFNKFALFGLDNISNQLYFCLHISKPLYIVATLLLSLAVYKGIFKDSYGKSYMIFFWVLILLFIIFRLIGFYFITNSLDFNINSFEYFKSSLCY